MLDLLKHYENHNKTERNFIFFFLCSQDISISTINKYIKLCGFFFQYIFRLTLNFLSKK